MQWRSYTQAYLGLCPRKIHWCTGKNNVESYMVKDQLLSMWNRFHVNVKQAY